MNQLITTARQYLASGLSVTLTDNRKVSLLNWKDFQSRIATEDELQSKSDKAQGIAIICGAISGNLEVIDIFWFFLFWLILILWFVLIWCKFVNKNII